MRNRFLLKALILTILSVRAITGSAQNKNGPRILFYNVPELAGNQVYDFVQDSAGFIWIGTQNGLYKYDGYSFKSYEFDFKNKQHFPIGPVRNICLDKHNQIWASVQNKGLAVINLKDESFILHKPVPASPDSLKDGVNTSMAIDHANNIWITTNDSRISKWDREKKKFIHFEFNKNEWGNIIFTGAFCDRKGNMWFGSFSKAIYRYNKLSNTIERIETHDNSPEYITDDNEGNIWISSHNWIFKLNPQNHNITSILGHPGFVPGDPPGTGYLLESEGVMWIGSINGVFAYNQKNGQIINYKYDETDKYSLPNNTIHKIFEDKSKNLWFGTIDGAAKISFTQRQSVSYIHLPLINNNKNTEVRALWQDKKGNIWAGTDGNGIIRIDKNYEQKKFLFDKNILHYGFNYVNCIYPDGDQVWLGTGQGLRLFNPETGQFKPQTPGIDSTQRFFSIYKDENGYLWLGSKDFGLYIFKPGTTNIQHIFNEHQSYLYSVWAIYHDKEGAIWLGTNQGLKKASRNSGGVTLAGVSDNAELKQANIFNITEDNDHTLWMASSDNGLMTFDKKTGIVNAFVARNEFPSNIIWGVSQASEGRLWVITKKGICLLDPVKKSVIKNYLTADGWLNNRFNFISYYKKDDLEILLGISSGIVKFLPQNAGTNTYQPDMVVTSFKTLFQDRSLDILKSPKLVLPYKENSFSLEFASMDFTNPEKNEFAYKLEGLSDEWTYSKNRHYAAFTNLDPGEYTLIIKGTNSEGVWSDKMLRIKLLILSPFWKTWWFCTIISALCLAFTGYIIYTQIYKKEITRKKIKAELYALRSQLNPHFIFNSLSSLQHFVLDNQNELANTYLIKFARLIRLILDNTTLEETSVKNEIDFLNLYFYLESIRLKGKVQFNIECNPEINSLDVNLPPMLIQPFVENAIIHGLVAKMPEGRIIVRFRLEGAFLKIDVEDNGIGYMAAMQHKTGKEKQHKSVGISIISQRLSILNKSKPDTNLIIKDLKENGGQGTIVTIKIPILKPNHKNPDHDKDPDRRR